MIKIALCDDRVSDGRSLYEQIVQIINAHKWPVTASVFEDGAALLSIVQADPYRFDAYFLDVIMPGMNGIELAGRLRERGVEAAIVITTGSPEYAFESYEISAADYLLKPVTKDKLERALSRCFAAWRAKIDTIEIIVNKRPTQIVRSEICYVEVFKHLCSVHAGAQTLSTYLTLDAVAKMLGGSPFVKCHKSYLVNLSKVERVTTNDLALTSGELIPIGRSMRAEIHRLYNDYLIKQVWDQKRGGDAFS